MQNFQLLTSKIGEFIGIFQQVMLRDEREAQIKAIKNTLEPILSEALIRLSRKATDQQKFISATMLFDMIFNVPDKRHQQRVQQQIIQELPECNIAYSVLQQAFDSIDAFEIYSTAFDPIIEALFATFMISSLDNEDEKDPEMQNIFATYADSYALVSTNSCIIEDIIIFQQMRIDYDIYLRGESQFQKL